MVYNAGTISDGTFKYVYLNGGEITGGRFTENFVTSGTSVNRCDGFPKDDAHSGGKIYGGTFDGNITGYGGYTSIYGGTFKSQYIEYYDEYNSYGVGDIKIYGGVFVSKPYASNKIIVSDGYSLNAANSTINEITNSAYIIPNQDTTTKDTYPTKVTVASNITDTIYDWDVTYGNTTKSISEWATDVNGANTSTVTFTAPAYNEAYANGVTIAPRTIPIKPDDGKNDNKPDDNQDATPKRKLALDGAKIISVKNTDGKEFDLDDIKNADGSYNIPEGAVVTIVPANKVALADSGSVFDHWDITGGVLYQPTESEDAPPQTVDTEKEQLTFVMPSTTETVSIKLMTRDATIDEGPDALGTAVIVGTAAVGGAILAWQGYQLSTELYLKTALPDWAVIPNNRMELAALLWRDAGQPAPESQTLYSDIDANDADAQNAARWAVENELISLPDEDAPDTFQPYSHVSRIAVIKAWKKAQEMKH